MCCHLPLAQQQRASISPGIIMGLPRGLESSAIMQMTLRSNTSQTKSTHLNNSQQLADSADNYYKIGAFMLANCLWNLESWITEFQKFYIRNRGD